jgi:hypothetical protein
LEVEHEETVPLTTFIVKEDSILFSPNFAESMSCAVFPGASVLAYKSGAARGIRGLANWPRGFFSWSIRFLDIFLLMRFVDPFWLICFG